MSNELTFFERQKLQYWLRTSLSLRSIAKLLLRDHSIVVKEIKRNSSGREKYRADIAQGLWEERRKKKRNGKLDKYPELKKFVEEKLLEDWSPEQISGKLKEFRELGNLSISPESIYYYIYEKSDKWKQFYKHLRTNRVKRINWGKRKNRGISIKDRVSINLRPEIINERKRMGDWESDTVEFKRIFGNKYLSVQFERKSQLCRIHKLESKEAGETLRALIKTSQSVDKNRFKSVTFDNGSEGSSHYELKNLFGVKTYFCDSFKSWQKGGVENMNKLIRQYLPRNTDLKNVSEKQIYLIQERLNNRPRKKLKYLSPNEFWKSGAKLT
jgi:transposase, IS30 family